MSENINIDQRYYDSLIAYANIAYENSSNGITGEYWLGKSEAYEFAAAFFSGNVFLHGVYIKTVKTKRQIDLDEAIEEKIHSDVKNEDEAYTKSKRD